jgi:hypothetical protein
MSVSARATSVTTVLQGSGSSKHFLNDVRLGSDRLSQFYGALRHAKGCGDRGAGAETTNEGVAQASGTTAPECRFGAGS